MKKLLQTIARNRADFAIIMGAAAIAAGVGMIYIPAGVIVAGVMVIVFAVAAANSGGGEE